jgi:membrane protease subunit (stomatin/prohibitin family)
MPRLLRGVARTAVVAGTATAVSGRVRRRQDARWAQEDDPQQDYQQQGQQPAAAPPAAPAEADYTAELEKLAKLRDEGVITADDFDAKKKQLLGI